MLPSFSYLLLAKKKRHFKLTISIYIPSAACHIPAHIYIVYTYVHDITYRFKPFYQQKYYFQFVSISLMWFGAALQHYHNVYASVQQVQDLCPPATLYMKHTQKHYPANFLEQNKHVSQSRFNLPVCDDVVVVVVTTEFSSFTHSTTLNT